MNFRPLFKKLIRTVSASVIDELINNRPALQRRNNPNSSHGETRTSIQKNTVPWNFAQDGLPNFSYTPDGDSLPDPGEVVWTWIPFEENNGQGKDRPVLVVSVDNNNAICAQMTSKDHAHESLYRDAYHRWWLDVGTGNWDNRHRSSEVRLDILWKVPLSKIRRIGGALSKDRYEQVVHALSKIHS